MLRTGRTLGFWVADAVIAAMFVHYVEKQSQSTIATTSRFPVFAFCRTGPSSHGTGFILVRDLSRKTATSLALLRERLCSRGVLSTPGLGRVGTGAVRARDFFDAARELLADSPMP